MFDALARTNVLVRRHTFMLQVQLNASWRLRYKIGRASSRVRELVRTIERSRVLFASPSPWGQEPEGQDCVEDQEVDRGA